MEEDLKKFFIHIARELHDVSSASIYPDDANESRFLSELERQGLIEKKWKNAWMLAYDGKNLYDELKGI